MRHGESSIFQEYYTPRPFVDRFADDPSSAVDIIVPVMHTNELWQANLLSFYREVPVHRLLIGDGGCIDDSIAIARTFPRVEIFDHSSYKTLGYSIRELIEAVSTDWFLYLHSDAYLPAGWFDAMQARTPDFDWFGCRMRHTIMVEYDLPYGERPWAGTQMGRRAAFLPHLARIDDDYVYRQEDFVFADIVRRGGFREGTVPEAFHYHQTMYKPTPWFRKVKSVAVELEMGREEEARTVSMQTRGIVKYLEPTSSWLITDAALGLDRMIELGVTTRAEFLSWVKETNPVWIPFLERGRLKRAAKRSLRRWARSLGHRLLGQAG